MATKKKEPEVQEKEIERYSEDDRIEIQPLFYDADKYSAAKFVCVNGRAILIPRGKPGIKIGRAYYEVLKAADKQVAASEAYSRAQSGIKNLGEF